MNTLKDTIVSLIISILFLIIIVTTIVFLLSTNKKADVMTENIKVESEIINENKIDNIDKKKEFKNVNEVLTEKQKMYVAHAGGKTGSITCSNSLEAIKETYDRGYRLIEIDIEWTSDNVPILLHDWSYSLSLYYEDKVDGKVTYEEFKNLKMKNNLTNLSLDDVMKLIQNEEYEDLYIITDVKEDNIKLLNLICEKYSNVKIKIIPQVYSQEEYHKVKEIGFKDIIYTLYLSDDSMEEIIEFSKQNNVFAITMDTSWAYSLLPVHLTKENVYTYAHTINDVEVFNVLKNNGIKGIYTDILFE